MNEVSLPSWQRESYETSRDTLNPRDGFAFEPFNGYLGTCRVYDKSNNGINNYWVFELHQPTYIDYVHVMGAAWEGSRN